MDFSSSFKRSFRSPRHGRKNSNEDPRHPILSDHDASTSHSVDHRDFIVKIDGGDKDPPSRLIGDFLNKQKNSGSEMTLDMDLDMDELRHGNNVVVGNRNPESPGKGNVVNPNSSKVLNSREIKVSFQPHNHKQHRQSSSSSNDDDDEDEDLDELEELNDIRLQEQQQQHVRRKSSNLSNSSTRVDDKGGGDVLKCTSFQKRATIMRTRTHQSRLFDPPEAELEVAVSGPAGKSGQYKSGMLAKSGILRPSGIQTRGEIEEEDDTLFDEDNPDDFKRTKLDAITLIQWISLILILSALICTLSIQNWKRKSVRGLQLWEWEVLVLVLICGRLVSGWGIRFIVFFIERNLILRKRVLYFVYGIRKPVQNCIWLGLVLIAWHYMFDEKVEGHNRFLRVMNKLMVCMLVATSLWLVKTLIVKVLASSFHVKKFFDRIQEALFNQYVIETLSGPPLVEIQNNQIEEEKTMAEIHRLQNAGANVPPELGETVFPSKSGRGMGSGRLQKPTPAIKIDEKEQGISIDHLDRLNPKNVSAWNMKRLMRIVRLGTLSTLDEQLNNDINEQEDDSVTQIRSEIEAKRAARKIFMNVAKNGSKFIYLRDLTRFLREDQAVKTMSLLVGTPGDERVSKAALKTWVVNAFRERKALALTLNDTKTAVNKLHQMVNVLAAIIIVVICLLILNIATGRLLVFISSQIVVVAFIFGNTCKTVFEAIIFLFVMHPFDVGDRCEIDGTQMIVEEMNILTTVFLKWDNEKVYFPNSTLATRAISNHYRSPDMWDSIDFFIHITTPGDTLAVMKQRITKFIEGKKDHYYPTDITVVSLNLQEINKIKLQIWWRHKINFQDMSERFVRKGAVIDEMVRIFKEHDVDYRLYPLDINIKNMPPVTPSRNPPSWEASK